ncbi:autotransporter-associated beta strand repeat-containing protein, partial [Sulfitobacter pacificus]
MLHFSRTITRAVNSKGLFLTTALVSGLIALPGHAQDAVWVEPGPGTYADGVNWDILSPPGATDTAIFLAAPFSTVTIGITPVAVGNLDIISIGSIENGTFEFNNGSASTLTYSDLQPGALASSVTLDLNGADLSISSITDMDFGGAIENGGAAATLALNTTAEMTLSGVISGATAVTLGSGTATLSGDNTYTGGTLVSGGTLGVTGQVLGTTTIAGGAVVVNETTVDAALELAGATTVSA